MNIEEKIKILEESKIQIEKALKEQKKRAIKAAEKEAEYRKELAKEMSKQHQIINNSKIQKEMLIRLLIKTNFLINRIYLFKLINVS